MTYKKYLISIILILLFLIYFVIPIAKNGNRILAEEQFTCDEMQETNEYLSFKEFTGTKTLKDMYYSEDTLIIITNSVEIAKGNLQVFLVLDNQKIINLSTKLDGYSRLVCGNVTIKMVGDTASGRVQIGIEENYTK